MKKKSQKVVTHNKLKQAILFQKQMGVILGVVILMLIISDDFLVKSYFVESCRGQ